MLKNNYTHIIWDWNGTLLDDVYWCIESINKVLHSRNKTMLNSLDEYHNAFCFPIIEYYKNVGFNFDEDPFEVLAQEYIANYHGHGSKNLRLYEDAEKTLKTLSERNITQVILSASSKDNLSQQTGMFDIAKYFDEILGISDIYGKSKVGIGLEYISRSNIQKALLVGDTIHDFEVAQALCADCVLIANGHQGKEKLMACGVPILQNIHNVLDYIK